MLTAVEASHGPGGGLGHLWSRPMPVGRPRRPCAVSAADRRSRRRPQLQLRRRPRAAGEAANRQDVSPPGRCVGRSVALSVGSGRSFNPPSWCALFGVVCGDWGSGLWVSTDPGTRLRVSPALFASRLLSLALYVRACWHSPSVESPLASRVPVSSSALPWLARDLQSAVA